MLQAYLERRISGGWQLTAQIFVFFSLGDFINPCLLCSDIEAANSTNVVTDVEGFELSPEARAQADLKFTYVVTCQIYGKQKEERKPEAADIALLMQRSNFNLYAI